MRKALLLFLLASPALAGSNVETEHIMDTDDGAVYSIETSHGGPLSKIWRPQTKKGDTKQAAKASRQLCRELEFEAYRHASFRDVREDETLKAADEYLSRRQEDGHRTTFELVFFSSAREPAAAAWTACWSKKEAAKRGGTKAGGA